MYCVPDRLHSRPRRHKVWDKHQINTQTGKQRKGQEGVVGSDGGVSELGCGAMRKCYRHGGGVRAGQSRQRGQHG